MVTILVTGSRHWTDTRRLHDELDAIDNIERLIVGDAAGADKAAQEWASTRGVPLDVHTADWATHGRAAGPIRNQEMINEQPDRVVAFRAAGTSVGTDDCIHRAVLRGIPVDAYYATP